MSKPEPCPVFHNDPKNWDEKPDPKRGPGWLVTVCKHCGKWIGWRLPEQKSKKQMYD